jgi:hypothetical protein
MNHVTNARSITHVTIAYKSCSCPDSVASPIHPHPGASAKEPSRLEILSRTSRAVRKSDLIKYYKKQAAVVKVDAVLLT